jgi:hypothetical protein
VPFSFNARNPVGSWSGDTLYNDRVHHPRASLNGGDGDGDDPTKFWFRGTKPYVVLRYFALEDVTDDEIKNILRKLQIRTLEDLKNKMTSIYRLDPPVLKEETAARFSNEVYKACETGDGTAEGYLIGEVVYDEKTILDNAYYTYSEDAVSVTPLEVDGSREFNYTLVLGPSGSGKTMFALRRLPSMIFEEGETFIFRVQFRTKLAYQAVSSEVSFPEAVATYVQNCITEKLSGTNFTNLATVDLKLHVILDEAGSESYKPFLDSARKITEIVTALQNMVPYRFLKGVHVTLVGTGLELTTLAIDSTADTTKFRMQPWTVENFDKLVDVSSYPEKQKVKQAVRRFPILMSLVANARCAYLLLKAMPEAVFLEKENWLKSSLNGIISKVVHYYINSNALWELGSSKDKWAVVRSVFKEVDDATRRPNIAFFPRFADLDPTLRAVAACLVDVNTETDKGKLILKNKTYSVSMSSALFVVVSVLLNANAEVSWDWQAFESTVALGEWKCMVVQSQDAPSSDDKTIMRMPYPVPATNAKKTMTIPKMNQFMVVINGEKASYADVIAPFRLAQAKFAVDAAETHTLDLLDELNKMGLTNSSKHTKQQALTSVLYQNWSRSERVPAATKDVTKHWPSQQARSEYFPSDKLVTMFTTEVP